MLGSYEEVPEVGDALLSSSHIPENNCLQFYVTFLTPKSFYFQTQPDSSLLPHTRCPGSRVRRVLGGKAEEAVSSRQSNRKFALSKTMNSGHKVQHFIPYAAIP